MKRLRLFNKMNSEKGMVSIEATIALTAFLFLFLMVYSITTIARAQARIQVALNNTAQEISQYSYLYGLTGLDKAFAKFQDSANNTKDDINNFVGTTVDVFNGIQTLGNDIADVPQIDITDTDALMSKWETLSADIDTVSSDASAVKEQLENMAANPQELLFGIARLVGSEALDIAKSRLIAEPVTRALIQKHLKRSNSDTANAFCASVGIVPGTYLGTESYFNGIDFSNSTLFAYGSEDIVLHATYEVKLLQLLPLDLTFKITQSAATKGWLHGDQSVVPPGQQMQAFENDETVWNSMSLSDRNSTVRSLELDKLKNQGYSSVSGETYIQAYNETTNTVTFIACLNPVYGTTTTSNIDSDAIKEDIDRMIAQMNSSTNGRNYIYVKKKNPDGSITTDKIDCGSSAINKTIKLIVPEDAGVLEAVQEVVNQSGYAHMFDVTAGYGSGLMTTAQAGGQ